MAMSCHMLPAPLKTLRNTPHTDVMVVLMPYDEYIHRLHIEGRRVPYSVIVKTLRAWQDHEIGSVRYKP